MRNGGAITFATANIASVIDVLKKVSPFGFFFSPTSRHSDSFASELNAGDEFHGRADARIPLGRLRGPQLPHSTPWLLVPAPLTRVIASRQGRRPAHMGQYQSGSDCFHRALSKSVNSDCKQRGMDPVQASKWTKAEMRASSRKHFAFFKLAYYTR
jgi:hypothetical protein